MGIGLVGIVTNQRREPGGGGPPFPANSADNGLSVSGGVIVLGNDVGDVLEPALLLSDRSIPLGSFTLGLVGDVGPQNPFLLFDHGNTTDTLVEYQTLQGSTFGNYFLTVDETTVNPDTQRDAVMHFGYNITGTGGRRNPAEPSMHDAWESHFDPGTGVPQMERHIEFSLPTGELSRVVSWQMRTTAPLYALVQHRAEGWTFSSTDDSLNVLEFSSIGDFTVTGSIGNAFIRLRNRDTGPNFTMQCEGGEVLVSTDGTSINFQSLVYFAANTNAAATVARFFNSNAGSSNEIGIEFWNDLQAAGPVRNALTGSNHAVPNQLYWSNENANGQFAYAINGAQIMKMLANGNIGIGITTPTASLNIKAGTAAAGTGPIKLTAGTFNATGETGNIEYDGTNITFVRTGTTRETMFTGNSGAAAPATTIGVAIANFYGTAAANFLGDPNSWAGVVIGGVTYKIPLYT